MKGLRIVESKKNEIKLVEADPELLSKYKETIADGFSSGNGVKICVNIGSDQESAWGICVGVLIDILPLLNAAELQRLWW